ncbi:tRNA pseudouridine(38-40) synthase TruA [Notoacmeibacter ruber]|uniref:tRNA pseudouridine synthase A n=1 Tax=Notoacmeibacter ruber TaxID=2670375 RepID=A0A3L7J975_9HYPH|nr:tRNA pseudouridine(38-40) synthase TruA [Notoacmeibacter ruber]RLQ87060.1 tRNA pseudouridine(38-40) synthase TruA [Notoacmeibacter ruber]
MSDEQPTQRYRATVEYDGTPYKGFQRQANGHSVQQAIEEAIYSLCGADVRLTAAGRTDTGVHALAQVIHFDIPAGKTPFRVMEALNALLVQANERVAFLDCETVGNDFSARFSATGRRYLYRIINRRAPLTVERERAWWIRKGLLDVDRMNEGAKRLLGTHDFTTFRAADCQAKSPIRTLDELWAERIDEHEIHIHAAARSFLHNQVRSLAGSLKLVGDGKWSADDLKQALEAMDRKACGPVAPAHGLYLSAVSYRSAEGASQPN